MSPRDLTAEEIAELEKLRAVAARSLQDAAAYRDALYLQGDGLLAMASHLLELEADLRKRTIEICGLVPEDAPVEAKRLIDALDLEVTCEWERANMAEAKLRELEAALEFLDRGDGNRGTHGSDMRAPALLSLARKLGFPGLNAKGGENV